MKGPITRWGWFALGWTLVGLGFVGLALPVMPGTIFFILAAACFSHSSPRFERWLLDHKWFGSSIRNWRARGAIPFRAKVVAIASMAGGYGIMLFTAAPAWWIAAIVAALMITSAAYVASRPNA